jgi:hypothetical protein
MVMSASFCTHVRNSNALCLRSVYRITIAFVVRKLPLESDKFSGQISFDFA